jgi:hypothetical protein
MRSQPLANDAFEHGGMGRRLDCPLAGLEIEPSDCAAVGLVHIKAVLAKMPPPLR